MHRNRFAVFGQPVAHSRSPAIHAAFAAQFGIALEYVRIEASPAQFADAVARFAADGGRGANVTLPHKEAAAALCVTCSERATRAGAVNTLQRLDDAPDGTARWHGDNTDGIGLVRDLRDRHGLRLEGARVLLIGAGGAAAGVAPALLDAGVSALAVCNRTSARTAALLARLDDPRLRAMAWPTSGAAPPASDGPFDVVINTSSAARGPDAPAWPWPARRAPGWAAVDLGYGADAACFLDAARGQGARVLVDGLGMLVEQAAESFHLWHGRRPDTAGVYARMRRELPAP